MQNSVTVTGDLRIGFAVVAFVAIIFIMVGIILYQHAEKISTGDELLDATKKRINKRLGITHILCGIAFAGTAAPMFFCKGVIWFLASVFGVIITMLGYFLGYIISTDPR